MRRSGVRAYERVYPRPCGGARYARYWVDVAIAEVYPRPCGGASCDTDITVASCGGLGQLRTHVYLRRSSLHRVALRA